MRKMLWVIAAVLLVAAAWVYRNHRVRLSWDSQYRIAQSSLSHLMDHKDDSAILYGPRSREFESLVDQLHEAQVPTYGHKDLQRRKDMVDQLAMCGRSVDDYRAGIQMANEAIQQHTRQGVELLKTADDLRIKTLDIQIGCMESIPSD